jgi:hypothetical protein
VPAPIFMVLAVVGGVSIFEFIIEIFG